MGIQKIVRGLKFSEYAANVHFGSLRELLTAFLPLSDIENVQAELQVLLDIAKDVPEKVLFIRLFFDRITNAKIQKVCQDFLTENFLLLSTDAIYDFVFSGWLTITSKSASMFLNEIIEIKRQQPKGVHSFPDPVDTKLECVYILFISGNITDITALKGLAEDRNHLQFLLNPDSFDYGKVDFSDYMWVNFAHHEKYMKYFIMIARFSAGVFTPSVPAMSIVFK